MPTAPFKAMILAAGLGERMRPLTDHTPKPLLSAGGKALIVWQIERLRAAGFIELIINHAHLGQQIEDFLADGAAFGVRIQYSREPEPLETAGGMAKALPLLADGSDDCFWLVSADIHAPDFRFDSRRAQAFQQDGDLAHLWLVPNPPFHAAGDFGLDPLGRVTHDDVERPWTYANLALCRAALVAGIVPGERVALGPLLFDAARAGRVAGEALIGPWHNIGTPEQLALLNAGEPG